MFASEIYATLQSATGVLAADIDVFQLKHYQDLTAIERSARGRCRTASAAYPHLSGATRRHPWADRPFCPRASTGPTPPGSPAEQAYIEEPAADLVLTAVEAL